MRDYVKIHISLALMERAATVLEATAAHRRDLIAKTSEIIGDSATSNWDDNSALDAARQMERDAHEIRQCVSYLPEKATEKDQLTAIQELSAELEKEGLRSNYHYASPAENIRGMFRQAMDQRQQAFEAWAALVDDQRINLRAVKLMVQRALQCDTHKRKNSTLYVLLDTMENMFTDLMALDVDDPHHYDHWSHGNPASMEVRKVMAENRKLQERVKNLENTEKVDESKAGQAEDASPVEQIPF